MKTIGIPMEMYYYKEGFVLKNLFEFLGCNVLIDVDKKNVDYMITNKKDIKEDNVVYLDADYKNIKKVLKKYVEKNNLKKSYLMSLLLYAKKRKEEIIKNVDKLYNNKKKILLVGIPHIIHDKNVINEIELKYKNMEIIYSDLFDDEIDVINYCVEYVDYIVIYKNDKKEVSIEKIVNK